MKISNVIVKTLIAHDVKHVFGVPGDTTMNLYEAFYDHKEYIKHILTRDERNASYMADAYAKVSGKPGIVEVPSGGGALYAIPGISEANASSIPLICLSSDISMSSEETNALTDTNQEYLFKPITKWNTKIRYSNNLPFLLKKAFRLATSGVPGSVQLSIPENILAQDIEFDSEIFNTSEFVDNSYYFKNEPNSLDINKIIDFFSNSERPIIIAGGGVHLSNAYEQLAKFVENFGIPVATSINGKGSIQEFSSYSIGVIGANGGSKESLEICQNADLVMVLGSKLNNVTTMGRTAFNKSAVIVQIDIGEKVLNSNIPVNLAIMADIDFFLSKINLKMSRNKKLFKNRFKRWHSWIIKKIGEKYLRINDELNSDSENVLPAKLFNVLENISDNNTIFTADAGTPTPYLASHLRLRKAGRNTIIARGHGSLGYAIPAAIGAKIARPEAKVISLFGDGSFCMSVGELETAKRLDLPITFINLQNDSYGWIKTLQKLYYNKKYFSVDFSPINTEKIAKGFGIRSWTLQNNSELEEGIKEAINQNSPVLLNIIIEPPTKTIPPVIKWERDIKVPEHKRKKLTY
jgi:acetolactate synthase I/II/III large subunit